MEGQGVSLAQLAEELGISGKTVRRAAQLLGVPGRLERARHGVARCFGPEEAERLRAHLRATGPGVPIEEPEPTAAPPAPGTLALPVPPEVLDLLADMRDVVARAAGAEIEVGAVREEVQHLGGQVERLAEVLDGLVHRLPSPSAPPAPPSPPPRLRWRVVAEVVLLGWIGLLAGVLGAVVLQRLADVGVVTLPAWWPIG